MSTIPSLHYDDASRALDWLTAVFGFTVGRVDRDGCNFVWHAELWMGGDVFFMGSTPAEHMGGGTRGSFPRASVCVTLPSREAAVKRFEQAKARGARVLCEPTNTDYGTFEYWVADFEGNTWIFTVYEPKPLNRHE